jgi:hypothetical protein
MRRVERTVTTDDKQKLPPPPTVSAEAVEEARAAASSAWGIPKEAAEPAPAVFQPPTSGKPEEETSADEEEKQEAPSEEDRQEASSEEEKQEAPSEDEREAAADEEKQQAAADEAEEDSPAPGEPPVAEAPAAPSVEAAPSSTDAEDAGVPTPITKATEVFDSLLADVSAPIPVGVQTRRKAAFPDAVGASEQIVASRLKEAAPMSLPSTTEAEQERRGDGRRWLYAAGGVVLGILIGLAIDREPDTQEPPLAAAKKQPSPAKTEPKPRVSPREPRPEAPSKAPLPPAATYPDKSTAEPDEAAEPEAAPEPEAEPQEKQPAPAGEPRALGGVTERGTFIDELVVGDADKGGSCTSPRHSFSIADDERIYACFHITLPREGDRLTVRWRRDGNTKRRSFFPMTKSVEATRTRAFMKVREGYEGAWSVHISGPGGTELDSAEFTIVP